EAPAARSCPSDGSQNPSSPSNRTPVGLSHTVHADCHLGGGGGSQEALHLEGNPRGGRAGIPGARPQTSFRIYGLQEPRTCFRAWFPYQLSIRDLSHGPDRLRSEVRRSAVSL